jgi:hypothetical protein
LLCNRLYAIAVTADELRPDARAASRRKCV